MRSLAALLFAFFAAATTTSVTSAQSARLDRYDGQWLDHYAPYGMDFVPDGGRVFVWVNMAPVGERVDFSMLASDIERRNGVSLTAWVRGYHERDVSVPFRTSIAKVHFDCRRGTWQELSMSTYSANGRSLTTSNTLMPIERAVPGSQSYRWLEFACGVGAALGR